MCGIFVHYSKIKINESDLKKSLIVSRHRGPDNSSLFHYPINDFNLTVGHNRLSILDTSKAGFQPMLSKSGKYIITFNGEIYNHLEIRARHFKGFTWKSNSDTETLIECIEKIGINRTLEEIEGMYAFCVIDRSNQIFYVTRDIGGEKPLYMMINNEALAFSSDISNLAQVSSGNLNINVDALSYLLSYSYVPTPHSIYKDIFKIPQSTLLTIDLKKFSLGNYKTFNDFILKEGVHFNKYFDIFSNFQSLSNFKNFEEARSFVSNSLKRAVKKQLLSDVPLGAFLSGGVDSSLVCSIASESTDKLKTFNIGFEFNNYDESPFASSVAKILGTDHHTHICTKEDALRMIKKLPNAYSEPFADSSQIPTLLISEIASKEVKVILTGDCGDELFGGYNRYAFTNKFWKYLKFIPQPIKYSISKLLLILPPNQTIALFKFLFSMNLSGSAKHRISQLSERLMSSSNEDVFYKSFLGTWGLGEALNKDVVENDALSDELVYLDQDISKFKNMQFAEKMMIFDFQTYMSDDILCKVDRAAMNFSLETRVPFLDKNVINASLRVPLEYKLSKLDTKIMLKSLLSDYLPKDLIYRPKQGFGIPIDYWIKNELVDWTESLLSKSQNDKHNLFDQNLISRIWIEHKKGIVNNIQHLWPIIQFNQWYNDVYQSNNLNK